MSPSLQHCVCVFRRNPPTHSYTYTYYFALSNDLAFSDYRLIAAVEADLRQRGIIDGKDEHYFNFYGINLYRGNFYFVAIWVHNILILCTDICVQMDTFISGYNMYLGINIRICTYIKICLLAR